MVEFNASVYAIERLILHSNDQVFQYEKPNLRK